VRRVFWVAVGLGVGVTVGIAVTRWARRKSEALGPANLGRQAADVGRDVGRLFREAAAEFSAGAREKEAEIRAALGE
jgi:hypothetical protein